MERHVNSDIYDAVRLSLEPTSFRLLTLHPGTSGDPISCTLPSTDFECNEDYEALSYTWEKHNGFAQVRLNGHNFDEATKNLVSALHHLRDPDRTRTLWVDALCINQESNIEKTHQIRCMAQIYKRAKRVLVWLGETIIEDGRDITSDAKDLLRNLASLSHEAAISWDQYKRIEETMNPAYCNLVHAYYTCIPPLLRSQWFSRVWVLQEVAMGKEVTVIRGSISLEWSSIVDGLSALSQLEDQNTTLSALNRYYRAKIKVSALCREFQNEESQWALFRASKLADRLATLLLLTNGLGCTDPRDHLFALLNMAGSQEEIEGVSSLMQDYNIPTEEVLKELAIYLLKSRNNLDIFYGVSWVDFSLRKNLPSWVPTWDAHRFGHLRRYVQPTGVKTSPMDAPAEIRISEDSNTVTIKGRLIDQIEIVGRRPMTPKDDSKPLWYEKSFLESWEEECLKPFCEKHGITIEDGLPVWLPTLFHDQVSNNQAACDASHADQYLALREYEPVKSLETEDSQRTDVSHFIFSSQYFNMVEREGAMPFVTKQGFIGLSDCAAACPGDYVCVFKGSPVPYIIRHATEAEYILSGPCYLWPFMKDNDNDWMSEQYEDWITLC